MYCYFLPNTINMDAQIELTAEALCVAVILKIPVSSMYLTTPKKTIIGRTLPYVGSLAITAALFVALPLTQMATKVDFNTHHEIGTTVMVSPPPNPPEIETPPEEKTDEEAPELDQEMQKLSLDQISMALNPGAGGMNGTSSINMASFELSDSLTDMIFEIADLDEAPEPIVQIAPVYPSKLKKSGVQGRVWIMFIVDENGLTSKQRVTESPHDEFAESAIKAVRQWKFKPGKKEGKAVKTRVQIPLAFTLKT